MPTDPTKSLASMGIYVFDAAYLYELLEEDDRNENSSHDFGKDIIPKITEAGMAYAHPFPLSCAVRPERRTLLARRGDAGSLLEG